MTIKIDKPIVLVGLMGAGKSTIGHRLAEKLEIGFEDIDHLVEKYENISISKIFETKGESYFRDLEKKIIIAELDKEPKVIATGGGAFLNEETRDIIKKKALSVWLRAGIETILERVSRNNDRPLLEGQDKRKKIEQLIEERHPIYSEADLIVDSDQGPHYKVVEQIIWKL